MHEPDITCDVLTPVRPAGKYASTGNLPVDHNSLAGCSAQSLIQTVVSTSGDKNKNKQKKTRITNICMHPYASRVFT